MKYKLNIDVNTINYLINSCEEIGLSELGKQLNEYKNNLEN